MRTDPQYEKPRMFSCNAKQGEQPGGDGHPGGDGLREQTVWAEFAEPWQSLEPQGRLVTLHRHDASHARRSAYTQNTEDLLLDIWHTEVPFGSPGISATPGLHMPRTPQCAWERLCSKIHRADLATRRGGLRFHLPLLFRRGLLRNDAARASGLCLLRPAPLGHDWCDC